MTTDLLTISDLTVTFGDLIALDGASLTVGQGRVVAIVGESGSGKSVLARSVLGLVGGGAKVEGRISFRARESEAPIELTELTEPALNRVRGAAISLMVQDAQSALNPVYRIGSQIMETLILKRPEFASLRSWERLGLFRSPNRRSRLREAALRLLADAGLDDPEECFRAFPHQLSGGGRQRVMLALAALSDPCLLITDEPTTALDVVIQSQILTRLVEGVRRRGSSLMLISHDLHLVGELADEIVVLYAGRIMENGPAGEVLANPAHPYTQALLASTPRFDTPKGALRPIPGEAPSPKNRDLGCLFRSRCSNADHRCADSLAYKSLGSGRRTLCRLEGQKTRAAA
jgi:oligopeptide/dipeptide ABC transporter ATP-binding protein